MENEVAHSERTSMFYYFRNMLSVCLIVLAMFLVLLKEWPSSISFEYPVIAIILAPVSVPGIGSIILGLLATLIGKGRVLKWIGSVPILLGLASLIYMFFLAAPLQDAAANSKIEKAKTLLDWGANVNVRDGAGYSPLHKAVAKRDVLMAKLLIARGANVNATSRPARNTPLVLAAGTGSVECVELLLQHGAAPTAVGFLGSVSYTPLQKAAYKGHFEVVSTLLRRGVSPNENAGTQSALHHACEQGYVRIAGTLLDKGADIGREDGPYRKTAAQLAIENGHRKIAEMLSSKEAGSR